MVPVVSNGPQPSLAICFFGITRSLQYTIGDLRKNVLAPLKAQGESVVLAHFFQQDRIESTRSGEAGALDPEEYKRLPLDEVALETPMPEAVQELYAGLVPVAEAQGRDLGSLRNLCHQLHSIKQVTQMALKRGCDRVLFCRPDLDYHNSLAPLFAAARNAQAPYAFVPDWQPHGGMNDRFALIVGKDAIRSYGLRFDQAADFVARSGRALHAETLVAHVLEPFPVCPVPYAASRVRFDGCQVSENFDSQRLKKRMATWRKRLPTPIFRALRGIWRYQENRDRLRGPQIDRILADASATTSASAALFQNKGM